MCAISLICVYHKDVCGLGVTSVYRGGRSVFECTIRLCMTMRVVGVPFFRRCMWVVWLDRRRDEIALDDCTQAEHTYNAHVLKPTGSSGRSVGW